MVRDKRSLERLTRHTFGSWRAQSTWREPLFIQSADGSHFRDAEGKKYLDFSSQLMCSNLGHGNEAIAEAIRQQAERLPYVSPSFACESKALAVESLLEAMPPGLDRFFFSTSGTEANEAALKIIRQYMKDQGKYKIVSRYRSYHGSTSGSIALTGDPRRWFAEPVNTLPGVIFAPDAYCYRCPFHLSHPGCGIQCAEYVDYMIKEEGNVAAIFVEPVVGTNGVIVPPAEYFPRLREIADENGVLLVGDEVMSGWYRTGKRFAIEHWGVTPDILTTAKGCTGAYTPVGVTATTGEIHDHFQERFFSHGHTYAMHPLALSAVPVALKEYERIMATGEPQRASEHLRDGLLALKDEHVSIGDVRGLGHFWAVEMVKNRHTREPFNTKADKASLKPLAVPALAGEMLKRGVYAAAWYNHFIIAPPLIVTNSEIDQGLQVMDEVLKLADTEASG